MKNELLETKNAQKEITIINEEALKNKIYTIQGKQVMLDYDLAELYGYTTKVFNQQAKK